MPSESEVADLRQKLEAAEAALQRETAFRIKTRNQRDAAESALAKGRDARNRLILEAVELWSALAPFAEWGKALEKLEPSTHILCFDSKYGKPLTVEHLRYALAVYEKQRSARERRIAVALEIINEPCSVCNGTGLDPEDESCACPKCNETGVQPIAAPVVHPRTHEEAMTHEPDNPAWGESKPAPAAEQAECESCYFKIYNTRPELWCRQCSDKPSKPCQCFMTPQVAGVKEPPNVPKPMAYCDHCAGTGHVEGRGYCRVCRGSGIVDSKPSAPAGKGEGK